MILVSCERAYATFNSVLNKNLSHTVTEIGLYGQFPIENRTFFLLHPFNPNFEIVSFELNRRNFEGAEPPHQADHSCKSFLVRLTAEPQYMCDRQTDDTHVVAKGQTFKLTT